MRGYPIPHADIPPNLNPQVILGSDSCHRRQRFNQARLSNVRWSALIMQKFIHAHVLPQRGFRKEGCARPRRVRIRSTHIHPHGGRCENIRPLRRQGEDSAVAWILCHGLCRSKIFVRNQCAKLESHANAWTTAQLQHWWNYCESGCPAPADPQWHTYTQKKRFSSAIVNTNVTTAVAPAQSIDSPTIKYSEFTESR